MRMLIRAKASDLRLPVAYFKKAKRLFRAERVSHAEQQQ